MAPHPTHRPDRLTRNECGRGDVSRSIAGNRATDSDSACAPHCRERSSSHAIGKTLVAFLPATRVAPTSIGAGAGKIADWSIAGRIGEGQPVPRFGSVARSPLTGRGSDGRPVQFLDTSAVLRARNCAITPVSVKFVRARLAGLPGLARIAVQRVSAALAGAVLQVKQVFLSRAFHASKIALESHPCPTSAVSDPTPSVPTP